MRNISIFVFEAVIVAVITIVGLSGKKILLIQGARTAVIVLGIIGMLFCTMSVGKFISSSPAHPLSILGYLFGTVALFVFVTQILKWNIPFINNPQTALIILAIAFIVKSFIARYDYFLK